MTGLSDIVLLHFATIMPTAVLDFH